MCKPSTTKDERNFPIDNSVAIAAATYNCKQGNTIYIYIYGER